jgi:hypothetical protein
VRDGSERLSEAEAGAGDKAPTMLELIVIGVAVSGVLALVGSIGRDRHDRLPPDALREGIGSPPLAIADDTEKIHAFSARQKLAGEVHILVNRAAARVSGSPASQARVRTDRAGRPQ